MQTLLSLSYSSSFLAPHFSEILNSIYRLCSHIDNIQLRSELLAPLVNISKEVWEINPFIQNKSQKCNSSIQRKRSIPGPCWYTHLFSSHHLFSIGFSSGDWDGHGRTLSLCSVIQFCVDFDAFFGLLSWWNIQLLHITRFPAEAVRFRFFYLLVFDKIHNAMHLNKMSRTSGRKTGSQY